MALKNNKSGSTNSVQCVVPTFVYDFEDGDERKWVTVAPFEWAADKGSGVSSDADKTKAAFPGYNGTDKIVYQSKKNINSFYLGKYRVEWMSRERNGNDDGIDYPVIRYADVLLMYAEACLGSVEGNVPDGADMAKAQECFDKVRDRANLSPVPLNMDNIIKERAFELCGENVRKWDLMRWGILKDKLVETNQRIAALNDRTGEFDGINDILYFQYVQNDALLYAGEGATATHAYEMTNIWGLSKSQKGEPAGLDDSWVKKNIMQSDEGAKYLKNYSLYADESLIEKRFQWPIFSLNVSASDGELWNDYDY